MKYLTFVILFLSLFQIHSLTINAGSLGQKIDGFGASNAWISYSFYDKLNADLQEDVLNALFSKTTGLGLSILRNRIPNDLLSSNGKWDWNNWDLKSSMKQYKTISTKYGVKTIFSTPWTPPSFMKDNGNAVKGSLKEAYYDDYANYLADYVLGVKQNYDVTLNAVSIQNEPDWKPDYESCAWTAPQFHKFVKNYLGPIFKKKNVQTDVIIPEAFQYTEDLAADTLNDAEARGFVDILGVHQYYIPPNSNFDSTKKANKRIWVTEICNEDKTYNPSIEEGIKWAKQIHSALTKQEVNAFCYWWLYNVAGQKNDVLVWVKDGKVGISKRSWALGHFSRFVRPGYQRVRTEASPNGIHLSAYLSKSGKKFIVVVINESKSSQWINLDFNGKIIGLLEHYRTSNTEDMSKVGTANLGKDNNSVYLEAQSINTYVARFA